MVISRDSKLIKFAYFGRVPERVPSSRYNVEERTWEYYTPPLLTSLCSLFWRTMGSIAMSIGAITFVSLVLYFVASFIFNYPMRVLMGLGFGAVVGALIYLIVRNEPHLDKFGEHVQTKMINGVKKVVKSPFIQGGLAVKRKMCPIIEIK